MLAVERAYLRSSPAWPQHPAPMDTEQRQAVRLLLDGVVVTQYLIRLSWPDKDLWQNRRPHWRDARRAARAARKEAWAVAKGQSITTIPNATLKFSFHPPNKIRRDIQNVPATMKAAIDGIADAMGCDDNGFRPEFPSEFSDVVKGGCVLIHVIPPVVSVPLVGEIS